MRRIDFGSAPHHGDFTVVFNSALRVYPTGWMCRQPGDGFRAHRTL